MSVIDQDPAPMIAIRPPKYGRAAQMHLGCCTGQYLNVEPGPTIEVKGFGVGEVEDTERDTLLSSDFRLSQEHASGTLTMGYALREFALYHMMRRALRQENATTGRVNFTIMPVYA
eukprot:1649639-Amphidinium_carterae.1